LQVQVEHTNSNTFSSPLGGGREEASASLRIIISGGGTGGHIFPAIAIANALKALDSNIDILFVGAKDRMEMEKVPAAGYRITGLPIAGFQRKKIYLNFSVVLKLLKSMYLANKIIKKYKPDIAVGVGGYASGPVLRAANKKGIPTVIQEQNSYAGITNRLLAKKAKRIFVSYEKMEKYFPKDKILIVGNPVRKDLEQIDSKRGEGINYFKLEQNKTTILSLGGSLGARTINQSIINSLVKIGRSNVQWIWQSGSSYHTNSKLVLETSGFKNIKLYDFINRMDLAFAAADIVISRAGASSISELCLAAKPAILVPSPNVAEDHQTRNAMALVNKEAAIMIADEKAKDELVSRVLELAENKELQKKLSFNISKLALHNSAENIAKTIIEIAKERKGKN
jgi:UDP-N-acetylglucosamine--N-acetylmuramyl-(pentapeptide) pyrophosphoryl-undecaprenol N-acetylglucosamine transferase